MKTNLDLPYKARFFAQYWNQKVRFWTVNGPETLSTIGHTYMSKQILKGCSLYLKPLSVITCEHAETVAKIIFGIDREDKLGFKFFKGYEYSGGIMDETVICVETEVFINYPDDPRFYKCQLIQFDTVESDIVVGKFTNDGAELNDDHADNILCAYDFLRSNGYALPWMGLTIEEMVKCNWIKLNNE